MILLDDVNNFLLELFIIYHYVQIRYSFLPKFDV